MKLPYRYPNFPMVSALLLVFIVAVTILLFYSKEIFEQFSLPELLNWLDNFLKVKWPNRNVHFYFWNKFFASIRRSLRSKWD